MSTVDFASEELVPKVEDKPSVRQVLTNATFMVLFAAQFIENMKTTEGKGVESLWRQHLGEHGAQAIGFFFDRRQTFQIVTPAIFVLTLVRPGIKPLQN